MEDLVKRLAKELTPIFPQRIRQHEVDCVICDMTADVEEMKITDEVEAEQYLREEFSKDDEYWSRPFNHTYPWKYIVDESTSKHEFINNYTMFHKDFLLTTRTHLHSGYRLFL